MWFYLWVPDVKYSRVGGTDDLDAALDVLAVEGYILASPANYIFVEASYP
jgi:hypothetical protein